MSIVWLLCPSLPYIMSPCDSCSVLFFNTMHVITLYCSSFPENPLSYLIFCSVCFVLDLIKEVLSLDDEIQKLATELYQQKSVLIMGRGYHYATCLEGALVSNYNLFFFTNCVWIFVSWRMTKTALILYTNNEPSVSGEVHRGETNCWKYFTVFLCRTKKVSAVIFIIAIVSDHSSHSLFE